MRTADGQSATQALTSASELDNARVTRLLPLIAT